MVLKIFLIPSKCIHIHYFSLNIAPEIASQIHSGIQKNFQEKNLTWFILKLVHGIAQKILPYFLVGFYKGV